MINPPQQRRLRPRLLGSVYEPVQQRLRPRGVREVRGMADVGRHVEAQCLIRQEGEAADVAGIGDTSAGTTRSLSTWKHVVTCRVDHASQQLQPAGRR